MYDFWEISLKGRAMSLLLLPPCHLNAGETTAAPES